MAKLAIVALAIGLVGVVTADYETIVYSPYTTLEADYNDPTVILRRRRHDNVPTSKITASSAISHEFPVEAHPLDAKAFPSRQRRSDEGSPLGGAKLEATSVLIGRHRRSTSTVTLPVDITEGIRQTILGRRRRSASVVTSPGVLTSPGGVSKEDVRDLLGRHRRSTSTVTLPGDIRDGIVQATILGRRRRSTSVVTSPGVSDKAVTKFLGRRRRGTDEVFYSPVKTEIVHALRKRDARGKRYALTEDERALITTQLG